jgi:hypothetical protein
VQTSAISGLATLFGDADRIAVVDVETTGLYEAPPEWWTSR